MTLRKALQEALSALEAEKNFLMKDVAPSHVGCDDMRVYHLDGGLLYNALNRVREAINNAKDALAHDDYFGDGTE